MLRIVPIRVDSGQFPACASASGHCGDAARLPVAPAGSDSFRLLRFWSPSGRENTIRDRELAPAFFGMPSATLTTGLNGRGLGTHPSVVIDGVLSLTAYGGGVLSPGVGSGTPFQPARVAAPLYVGVAASGEPAGPQSSGFLRIARPLPFRFTSSCVNGVSGWLLKTLLTWPSSETVTSPTSLIRKPAPSISRNSFQGLVRCRAAGAADRAEERLAAK